MTLISLSHETNSIPADKHRIPNNGHVNYVQEKIEKTLHSKKFQVSQAKQRHWQRYYKLMKKLLRMWLKTSISLVVVMGLTWMIGILFFNNDLVVFAYVITIFIAFQVYCSQRSS